MRRSVDCSLVSILAVLSIGATEAAQARETDAADTGPITHMAQALGDYVPRLAPRHAVEVIDIEPVNAGVLQAGLPFALGLSAPGEKAPPKGGISRNFRIELEGLRARVKAEGFLSVEESLQSGLAVAEAYKRPDAALLLTTLYMAHEFHAEALSVINETDGVREHADFVLLEGIANFKMGRFEDAIAAFSEDILLGNLEAVRWRGIANTRRGAYKAAAQDLVETPVGALSFEDSTSALLLAKAVTAIALADYVLARAALKDLQRSPLDSRHHAQRALLEAQLMLVQNRNEPGRQVLQQLVRSGSAPFSNMAALELLNERFMHGALDPGEAVERTNVLLLTWRGGAFERRALEFKAKMHEAAGDIGAAYSIRRQIMDSFPDADAGAAAEQQMRADLATLLERGELSPLDAAQIFYENIDLAPPGREGDDLIRKIADQLVALDLVSQAAELLHHQTFERLRGPNRSRVAADLAKLYLTDDNALMALQVLRSTRMARLPEAVNDQRRWLEARALIGTGDRSAALALLKKDTSAEGARIRGDIHWSEQQWALAGDAFSAAAMLPAKIDAQLDRGQSVLVLRAASAYGLAGAKAELRRLGRKVSGKLADTDANHLLEGLAFGGLADNPTQFRSAYRAFFGDGATAS